MEATIKSLKADYERRNPDGHWFEPSTMAFFDCRIHDIHYVNTTWLFTTSEQPPHGPRRWSLRVMDDDNPGINTLGEFCSMNEFDAEEALAEAVTDEIMTAS